MHTHRHAIQAREQVTKRRGALQIRPIDRQPKSDVSGSEKLTDSAGIWLKTRLYRKGHTLHAVTYTVAAGQPRVFELSLDLRPIALAAAKFHALQARRDLSVAGTDPVIGASIWKKFTRKVKKTVRKAGRAKMLRKVGKLGRSIARGTKAIVKSKITGAIGAVLTVFPPTAAAGAALTAGYIAANAAVKAIEGGAKVAKTAIAVKGEIESAVKTAKRIRGKVKKLSRAPRKLSALAKGKINSRAKTLSPAQRLKFAQALKGRIQKMGGVRPKLKISANVKARLVRAARIKKRLKNPDVRKRLLAIARKSQSSKKLLRDIAENARYGKGATRLKAQKAAAIVNLVAQNRARIRAAAQANSGGLPAMLIDRRGKITRGRFRVSASARTPGFSDVLYTGPGQQLQTGQFARIGCGESPCRKC